jgi:cation transport ATPase
MTTQRITLPIYNLGCGGGGTLTVERALTKAPGVARVYVNPLTEMAYVEYDPTLSSPDRLTTVIAEMGYGAPKDALRREVPTTKQATTRWDAQRLSMAAGLWLAVLYTLCIVADLLFPNQLQMYRLWELLLIGVSWAAPWTLILGLIEVFVYGAVGVWAFAAIYRALPVRARQ